jgi:RNA 2',3'-cyclic 3'-phosphodiesterase
MHRLFTAIDLPEEVRETIADIGSDLPGARRVPPDQLHLTLRFIGEVDEGTFAAVRSSLRAVEATGFSLALRGVGHFPPGRRPRVLWVGLAECAPLLELQKEVERALTGAGIPSEARRFSPHLTLARLKDTPPEKVDALEDRCRQFSAGPFPVTQFYLYSSTLTRSGAIHAREETYPLSAAMN